MIKILFVTRVPATSVHFILPLANKLREKGNIVEFAFGPGIGMKEMEESGFPFTILEMNKQSRSIKNFTVVVELSKLIKKGNFDLVHTYTPVIGQYGRMAAFLARAPIVIHSVIGSLFASGVPLSHRLMYIVSEWTTSFMVDLFITINEIDAQWMVKYKLSSAKKVALLKYEYGVDLVRFNPESIDKVRIAEARKKYRLDDEVPVIGFVGRMIGDKGIRDLFEAYTQIRARGNKAKLLFLGGVMSTDNDKRTFEQLQKDVNASSYSEDVVFLGVQSDVPFYISLMDIVVHPTYHEGFPRIPIEAGAMGKPSICTEVSGVHIAIEEGETGFIIPIKNPQRMAEEILKLISSPALTKKMGDRARQRVLNLFDQKKIVDQQITIYDELLRKKSGARKYSL